MKKLVSFWVLFTLISLAFSERAIAMDSILEGEVKKLSGIKGDEKSFHFVNTNGRKYLKFSISGVRGDADLSVWKIMDRGKELLMCMPSLVHSNEDCIMADFNGEFIVKVRAAKGYRRLKLIVEDFEQMPPKRMPDYIFTTTTLMDYEEVANGQGEIRHYFPVTKGQLVKISLSARTTDTIGSLYVRFDGEVTPANAECSATASEYRAVCILAPHKSGIMSILLVNNEHPENPYYIYDLKVDQKEDPIQDQRKQLFNQWTRHDLSAKRNQQLEFSVMRISDYTGHTGQIKFSLERTNDDVDLYVKYDGQVSLENYDCQSNSLLLNDDCVINPTKGHDYATLLIKGKRKIKGVSVTADIGDSTRIPAPDSKCKPGSDCRPGEVDFND